MRPTVGPLIFVARKILYQYLDTQQIYLADPIIMSKCYNI